MICASSADLRAFDHPCGVFDRAVSSFSTLRCLDVGARSDRLCHSFLGFVYFNADGFPVSFDHPDHL